MALSIREQILEAIKATLTAGGGPSGLVVKRYATFPADPAALPLIKFYPLTDPSEPKPPVGLNPLVVQKMQVLCECYSYGTATDGSDTDLPLDAVLQWVEQRLLLDPTFGGLAMLALPVKTDWTGVADDRSYIRADALYEIWYARRLGDLTTRA